MKYSILVILSLAPLLKKCAQEGAEQGSKRVGRNVLVNSSNNIALNSDVIVARIAAKSSRYFNNDFNKENQNVSCIDSTNTFIISNE
jgi:hypothetical protein